MIHQDYSLMLEERICRGGCGMKFKVMPTSPQFYARSNCLIHCKDRSDFIPADVETIKQEIAAAIPVIMEEPPIIMKISEVKAVEAKPKQKSKPKQSDAPRVRKDVESDLVSKTDMRLQQFLTTCISDAKKLVAKKDDLKSKMGLAYLCLTDISLRGEQNRTRSINNFAEAVGLDAEELKTWVEVRQSIWNRVKDPTEIECYLFEDLYAVMSFITDDTAEKDIQKVLDERISSKYLTLISHYRKSIKDIEHFYSKYSLDLLPQSEFDILHECVKSLHSKFKNHTERNRHRLARKRN